MAKKYFPEINIGFDLFEKTYYSVEVWRALIRDGKPEGARIMNFSFEKEYLKGEFVERATGWDVRTKDPLEWDSRGYCFKRGADMIVHEYHLEPELRFRNIRGIEYEQDS